MIRLDATVIDERTPMPNETRLKPTRRQFLSSAAVATAATIVPRHVLGGPNHVAPSDRVNVALVGAGGRGLQNVRELMKLDDVRVTTVIDPAERWDLSSFYYRGVAGRLPVCEAIEKHYQKSEPKFRCQSQVDFRDVIDSSNQDFDAVLCATPDHLHALVSLASLRADKHVYCEKPLTHNIVEARLIGKFAAESGLATQMGNQGHANDSLRLVCEWLRSGVLGPLKQVHAWVPATRWNPTLTKPPTESQPPPAGVNWDLWCGPRRPIPFHSAYAPVSWRDFWQFGLGAMGDFGCHELDSSVWGLELGLPTRVEMYPAGETDPAMIPFGELGYFDFDATPHTGPLRLNWYSGGIKPPHIDPIPRDTVLPNRGVMFVGENGLMLCGALGNDAIIYMNDPRVSATPPPASIPRSPGHHREWIDAIKGGPAAASEFSYAAKLTEITLLGVLALRTGKVIDWDAKKLKANGLPEADAIIQGDYRDGWKLAIA